MPRRALRCVVDLNIHEVSAPGVWLPSREDCYLSISLLGQYRNTRCIPAHFPLKFFEPFKFEKTYYSALDPAEVADFLDDELIIVELLQMSEYSSGAVRLATFSTSAREFLYPYPTLCPSYTSSSREMLMSRTVAFPGISPKLEFTTKSVIKESRSPELDALEDALDEEKQARRSRSRSRSRSRARSRSVSRSRSLSRSRTLGRSRSLSRTRSPMSKSAVRNYNDDDSLSSSDNMQKEPFVVRHLESSLIGRTPGAAPLRPQNLKTGTKSYSRPSSALGLTSGYDSDYLSYSSYRPKYHLRQVLRDTDGYATPVYTTKLSSSSDEDYEVAALTSPNVYIPPARRSTSPYLYKSSYSSRFSPRPLSPLSASISERVEKVLLESRIERALQRARSRSPSPVRYTPILRDSLENLALDTSIAKNRRYYSAYY